MTLAIQMYSNTSSGAAAAVLFMSQTELA